MIYEYELWAKSVDKFVGYVNFSCQSGIKLIVNRNLFVDKCLVQKNSFDIYLFSTLSLRLLL